MGASRTAHLNGWERADDARPEKNNAAPPFLFLRENSISEESSARKMKTRRVTLPPNLIPSEIQLRAF